MLLSSKRHFCLFLCFDGVRCFEVLAAALPVFFLEWRFCRLSLLSEYEDSLLPSLEDEQRPPVLFFTLSISFC